MVSTSLKRPREARDYGESLSPGERRPAAYAAGAVPSRGRRHAEAECPTRSPFQRDRDRVLHSTAFRRLIHKTQVFLYHEGDHYRTRLTHSLEVAQIARTIARQLRLDEDLAEALALAHDLGHSPFGHAGERALDRAMAGWGGFDHNAQSLRVVIGLERKYAAFDGLNLTWETLEGLAQHNGPIANIDSPVARIVRAEMGAWRPLDLERWASAEAQVAAIADDIAYGTHDIDDGLRAGLISVADLATAPLAQGPVAQAPDAAGAKQAYAITRAMITLLIADVVGESRRRLTELAPGSPDDIRAAGRAVVAFSPPVAADMAGLKSFLFARVYRHIKVMRVMNAAERMISALFARYIADVDAMPAAWAADSRGLPVERHARRVADFVAGMTDRYAIEEHRRLFGTSPELG
jgi:dGTPase